MARLEVRWTGEAQAEIAAELADLGLDQVETGCFVAEGEGRTLIKVVGALRDLQKRAHHTHGDETIIVEFRDPAA